MNCVACGNPAGYNRVVIDCPSGGELGGLCVNCERDEFGLVLERGRWADDGACALCPRDGHYALPVWHAQLDDRGARYVSSVDYEVTDRTPRLCDEHLDAIACEPVEPAVPSRHGVESE